MAHLFVSFLRLKSKFVMYDTGMSNIKIETRNIENSSMILRADYDPILETLKIYFRSGGVYEYCGVPRNVLKEIAEAESAGKYFQTNIRNVFEHMKKSSNVETT